MRITFNPIGSIHTPIKVKEGAPIQSASSEINGGVEVFPEFTEGLDGIEEFSHIYLLCYLNQSDQPVSWHVKPFLNDQTHGVFSTRHPCRPNPNRLSIIRLLRREKNRLAFCGANMLDATPLSGIKPYLPVFYIFEVTKTAWHQKKEHSQSVNKTKMLSVPK